MIKSLKIKNYALLSNVEVKFKKGFTVISGETGAGKSIMLDALSLILGKRVERLSANEDLKKIIIEGEFNLSNSKKDFFIKNNLDFEKHTIIRREINKHGKSRAFINDTPVLLSTLKSFGKQIIEIHSQHQSILLKEKNHQFNIVDQLANTENELENYRFEFKKFNDCKEELNEITNRVNITESELDFLKYQFDELEQINLIPNEKYDLEKQISILENSEGILRVISESEIQFSNENAVLEQLALIKRRFLEFEIFLDLNKRIESVIIELNDIQDDLREKRNSLESNPELLFNLNKRLDIINSLLQKHRKQTSNELIEHKNDIARRINLSMSFESKIKSKKKDISLQEDKLNIAVKKLNTKRNNELANISVKIKNCLRKLGMPHADFKINLTRKKTFNYNGNTEIIFLLSANKGSNFQELSKVASGGELSRLVLSIKYISIKKSNISTLIFDEIDSGVSGEIASLMGEMMLDISKKNQLISISHLPQIACKSNTHLKVIKKENNFSTVSDIIELDSKQRVKEIAKLLSGKKLTKAAIENAVELLNQ